MPILTTEVSLSHGRLITNGLSEDCCLFRVSFAVWFLVGFAFDF